MPVLGIDFAWGRPRPAAIVAAGYAVVLRYYSPVQDGKFLTPLEAQNYSDAGLSIVTVWEHGAADARMGAAAGRVDGAAAAYEARRVGQPVGTTIYVAVDYDAPVTDFPAIAAYIDAFKVATAGYLVGGYCKYDLGEWLKARGHITSLWQTVAWSGGRISHLCDIYQNGRQVTVDGVSCDENVVMTLNNGAWSTRPPGLPTPTPPPPPAIPVVTTPEESVTRHPLTITTDGQGHGNDVLHVPFATVVGAFANGADPQAIHAYYIPTVAMSELNGECQVEVQNGSPNATALVFVTTSP